MRDILCALPHTLINPLFPTPTLPLARPFVTKGMHGGAIQILGCRQLRYTQTALYSLSF